MNPKTDFPLIRYFFSRSLICQIFQSAENAYYGEQQWATDYGPNDVINDPNAISTASDQNGGMAYGEQSIAQPHQLSVQSQPDEYYTVSPGENYYSNYEANQSYPDYQNDNIAETNTVSVEPRTSEGAQNAYESFNQSVDPTTIEQPTHNTDASTAMQMERQTKPNRVPNYLQSDTDDSQIGNIDPSNANSATYPDSDFEFSTNS